MRPSAIGLFALTLAACDVRVGDDGVSLGVTAGKAAETWERTYALDPGGRLEVTSDGGPMTIAAARDSMVQVRIRLDARGMSDEQARELLDGVEIVEAASPGSVVIETRGPDGGGRGRRGRVAKSFEIGVPPNVESTFRTQNGAVQLDGINGRITASTVNGGITGRGLGGTVDASVVNGGLQVQVTSVTGPMTLSVVNGGIRLQLDRSVKANVEATAVNGGVSVGGGLPFVDTGGRGRGGGSSHLTGTLNGGGPLISLHANNGGIRIVGGDEPDPRR